MEQMKQIVFGINYKIYGGILILLINTALLVHLTAMFSDAHGKAVESRKQIQTAINNLSVDQQQHADDRYNALNKRLDTLFAETFKNNVNATTEPTSQPTTQPK